MVDNRSRMACPDFDRDPPLIPSRLLMISFFPLHVSWVVPIFALDSVSQVRLILHSISTLLHVLGEFFVKLILLHDTDAHRNDRVERKKNRDYKFYYFSFPFSRRERERS